MLGWLATTKVVAAPSCTEVINRSNVVQCALRTSFSVRAEEHGLRGVEARRRTSSVLLPSNPSLSVTGAYPVERSIDQRPLLWSATLSQELEIAGQRGARLRATSAETEAQRSRLLAAKRDVAARALLAYFNSIAATEDVRVTEQLTALADALRQIATERAKAGIGSDLDASLADAAAVRIEQVQTAAQERRTISIAELTSLLGVANSQGLRLEGELVPLAAVDTSRDALLDAAFARRTEVSIVMAERQLYASRVDLYRRLRIPNPTVSLFARKDWIGEQAIGIGLGFPIPLPAPLGTTYAGEIAEAVAMTERAGAEADAIRRAIAIEVITALAHVDASRRRVQLYTPERLQKTRHALMTIAEELAAGRLPPREALLSQQGLTDVLLGDVEARRSLCLATVAIATATGFPFEREAL